MVCRLESKMAACLAAMTLCMGTVSAHGVSSDALTDKIALCQVDAIGILSSSELAKLSDAKDIMWKYIGKKPWKAKLLDNDQSSASLGRDVLIEKLSGKNAFGGQIALLDVETGEVVSWMAVERKNGKYVEAKPSLKACSPRLLIPLFASLGFADAGMNASDYIDTGNGVYDAGNGLVVRDYNWRIGGKGKITYKEALQGTMWSNIACYKVLSSVYGNNANIIWSKMTNEKKSTNVAELVRLIYDLRGHCKSNSRLYDKSTGKWNDILTGYFGENSDSMEQCQFGGTFEDNSGKSLKDVAIMSVKEKSKSYLVGVLISRQPME